jgi:dsDNA-binding SOS-regulon protein
MDKINQLLNITQQLRESVLNANDRDREEQIEEINAYIENRGQVLEALATVSLSHDEKAKLKEIHEVSEEIAMYLGKIKSDIQEDILRMKKGKTAVQGYNEPYKTFSFDGHYFDRKK